MSSTGEKSEQCLIMFKQADYVMVTVSDMSRSVRFYRDVLGLPLKSESPEWSEFTTGPTTLALHGGGKQGPAQMGPRGESFAGTCSLGFNVDDLDLVFGELKSKGANFVMPPTQREGEGIKLAVCLDPDGLPIAFAQETRREERPMMTAEAGP